MSASFDALEAGGTVEGLFDVIGRLRGRRFAVRCFVVQVFCSVLCLLLVAARCLWCCLCFSPTHCVSRVLDFRVWAERNMGPGCCVL